MDRHLAMAPHQFTIRHLMVVVVITMVELHLLTVETLLHIMVHHLGMLILLLLPITTLHQLLQLTTTAHQQVVVVVAHQLQSYFLPPLLESQ